MPPDYPQMIAMGPITVRIPGCFCLSYGLDLRWQLCSSWRANSNSPHIQYHIHIIASITAIGHLYRSYLRPGHSDENMASSLFVQPRRGPVAGHHALKLLKLSQSMQPNAMHLINRAKHARPQQFYPPEKPQSRMVSPLLRMLTHRQVPNTRPSAAYPNAGVS